MTTYFIYDNQEEISGQDGIEIESAEHYSEVLQQAKNMGMIEPVIDHECDL